MATHNVSTSAQLSKAFNAARPGDVIKLAPGSYGKLDLNGATKAGSHLQFSKEVTVTSANSKNPAVFTGMMLHEVENLSFEGVKLDYTSAGSDAATKFTVQYSQDITFKNVTFDGAVKGGHGTGTGLKVKDTDDFTIQNSRFIDLYNGVKVNGGRNVDIMNNDFEDIAYDGMTFGSIDHLRVSGNYVEMRTDSGAKHKDLIQVVNGGGNPGSDIVISNNVLIADDKSTHGIYMGNEAARKSNKTSAFFEDVVIENNRIESGQVLGIALGETIDGVVRNNTVVQHSSVNSSKGVHAPVILVDKDSRGISITGNTTHDEPSAANYWKETSTPSSWKVSGNKLVALGTKAGKSSTQDAGTKGEAGASQEPTQGKELTGSSGSDEFRFDGRKLKGEQTSVLSNVDLDGGDRIVFIHYDNGTFDDVSGGNKLVNSKDGTYVRVETMVDLKEMVIASKDVSADVGGGDVTVSVAQDSGTQHVVLEGLANAYSNVDEGLF